MPSQLTVSVVIPVYRAEQTLADLHGQLSAAMSKLTPDFEIIFVEDGGGDGSWTIIESLARTDHRVRGIRMSRNYGQHNAILCGIRAAKHNIILTMDDDLQHPVSEIAPMLAALTPEFDVVYGAPEEEQHGLLRDLASRLTKFALAGAMGAETSRNVSAFRVFRTRLREGFKEYRNPSVSVDVLLTWTTSRFTAIKVRHAPRAKGESGYTPGKLIRHAVNLMTGFSTLPLQIASVVGFVFVLFGLSILAYVLANYLIRGGSVPGFTFLASMISIFSGAQLFALGIFGEYLARMHFRSMDRPPYLVGEIAALSDSDTIVTGSVSRPVRQNADV
jgi:glycosyltransferase involved in cell wall biosynthesis